MVMARQINKNLIAQDEWAELYMSHVNVGGFCSASLYTEVPTHERTHINTVLLLLMMVLLLIDINTHRLNQVCDNKPATALLPAYHRCLSKTLDIQIHCFSSNGKKHYF